MKEKDAYAITGYLLAGAGCLFYTDNFSSNEPLPFELRDNIMWYLKSLNMSYKLVMDILKDKKDYFYHIDNMGILWRSEFDYIEIDEETGRIGIWCEVDGFIAWLDEYKKVWTNSEKQMEKRLKKLKKRVEESENDK